MWSVQSSISCWCGHNKVNNVAAHITSLVPDRAAAVVGHTVDYYHDGVAWDNRHVVRASHGTQDHAGRESRSSVVTAMMVVIIPSVFDEVLTIFTGLIPVILPIINTVLAVI